MAICCKRCGSMTAPFYPFSYAERERTEAATLIKEVFEQYLNLSERGDADACRESQAQLLRESRQSTHRSHLDASKYECQWHDVRRNSTFAGEEIWDGDNWNPTKGNRR